MEQQRDLTIDIAKGITIFLMVWGHNTFGTFTHEKIYLFHVPLFFFLSGFFFKEIPFTSYLKSKTQRLLFPFVFYWIFIRVWNILFKLITSKGNLKDILDYIQSEEFLPGTGALWFLICLFLISTISYFLIRKTPKKYHLLILLISITIAYLLPQLEGKFVLYYGQALLMLPFYIGGYYFYNSNLNLYKYTTSPYRSYYIAIISGLLLLGLPWKKLDVNTQIWPNPVSLFLGAMLGILFILSISKIISLKYRRIAKFFSNWGKKSIHILGIHVPMMFLTWYFVIPTYMRVAPLLGFTSPEGSKLRFENDWLAFIVSILSTIMSYYLGCIIEKKYPWCFGIKKKI